MEQEKCRELSVKKKLCVRFRTIPTLYSDYKNQNILFILGEGEI